MSRKYSVFVVVIALVALVLSQIACSFGSGGNDSKSWMQECEDAGGKVESVDGILKCVKQPSAAEKTAQAAKDAANQIQQASHLNFAQN